MMYAIVAKNNGNEDKQIAKMVIAGFTGQLKGWWDNYLTIKNQNKILNTIKEENGETTH